MKLWTDERRIVARGRRLERERQMKKCQEKVICKRREGESDRDY